MLVGVCSVKGSPGATLIGLGLARVWPGQAVLFVEADPSGGDVAVLCGTGEAPGLVSLAAAARRTDRTGRNGRTGRDDGVASVDVFAHAHDLSWRLSAVPGPMGADQARAAVSLLASRPGLLAEVAAGFSVVVVDLGRLDPGSPAEPLLAELDLMLVVSQVGVHDLAHLAGRGPVLADRAGLRDGPALVGVVLNGPCRYRLDDVEDAVGLPVFAQTPYDEDGAAELFGVRPQQRRGLIGARRTSPLVAALSDLAERLDAAAPPRVSPAPAGGPAGTPSWAIPGPILTDRRADPDQQDGVAPGPRSAAEAGWTRPATEPATEKRPTNPSAPANPSAPVNPWVPATSKGTR